MLNIRKKIERDLDEYQLEDDLDPDLEPIDDIFP